MNISTIIGAVGLLLALGVFAIVGIAAWFDYQREKELMRAGAQE